MAKPGDCIGTHCVDCGQALVGRFGEHTARRCGTCQWAFDTRRRLANRRRTADLRNIGYSLTTVRLSDSKLSDRERVLLGMRYGVDGGDGQSLTEVARASGLTRGRVGAICEHALKKLTSSDRGLR